MSEHEAIRLEVNDTFILCAVEAARLEDDDSDRLVAAVIEAIRETADLPVVVDLCRVREISEDSLADLVDLRQHCRDSDRRLILAGLQQNVLEVLAVTKLGRLFEYRDDVEDARAHLQAAGKR
jgi:anti-anti-sigma factor